MTDIEESWFEQQPTKDCADRLEVEPLEAARDALQRARINAQKKGFRPGSLICRRSKVADIDTGLLRDDGREPGVIGDQIDRLLVERGWQIDVAVGSVMGQWATIVGADVAAHAAPVTFAAGMLTVRAESTAWATQLRLLGSTLLGKMEQTVGPDVVQELRVIGPNMPSWSRGLRKAHGGRGPRDTYG